jgi:hypothetical protein
MKKNLDSPSVAEQRKYAVLDVQSAKHITLIWLQAAKLEHSVDFGLPEVDDRYHIWRVPLLNKGTKERMGEAVIDARTSLLLQNKSTTVALLEARLLGRCDEETPMQPESRSNGTYQLSSLRNTMALGDCEQVLQELPAESIDVVFTSPPYYNARPEYTDYITYEEYLVTIQVSEKVGATG